MMRQIYSHYCMDSDPSNKNGSQQKNVARFLTIYLEEAHAKDRWYLPDSDGGRAGIYEHTCIADRITAAKKFVKDYSFESELVCDSFDGEVLDRYDAWPERLYIILNGVVVYKGGMGPFGYKLAEVQDWLVSRYGSRGEPITRR